MPKSVIYTVNQAASTKTANLFAGDVNEFVPYPANVRVTAVSSAIGIKLSVFADSDLLVDDKEICFIGTSLIDKDHVIDEFQVDAGTRLAVFARETAASATTDHYVAIEVTPLE
jgi:hypothetical protein